MGTNKTEHPEIVTFATDFNVTFGHLICQDLFNEKPTSNFVKNSSVTDVVVTTRWYDTRPFVQALEYQAGWSYASDVNLLVAGANSPSTGSSGKKTRKFSHGMHLDKKFIN